MTYRRAHHRLSLLIVVLTAGTLAGCASLGDGDAKSRALAPLVLPSRSGPPLDTGAAGQRYEEIINPHNEDINDIGHAVESGRPWTEVQTLVARAFQDNDVEAQNLAATAWPTDVAPLVDLLVRDDLAQRQRWSDAANAATKADFERLLKAAWSSPYGGQGTATKIRQMLGLGGTGDAPPLTPTVAG